LTHPQHLKERNRQTSKPPPNCPTFKMQFINLSIFAILAAFSAATPTANSVHQLERRQNCGNRASEAQSSAKLIVAARDRSRDVTCGLAQVLAPALGTAADLS
ncbi:hypothetical protein MJO28_001380, partial [Puccinia striiformis f. sp. tritici]